MSGTPENDITATAANLVKSIHFLMDRLEKAEKKIKELTLRVDRFESVMAKGLAAGAVAEAESDEDKPQTLFGG